MPNLIPEDSMLRRHYLTEVKSQMDKHFDRMLEEAMSNKTIQQDTIVYAEPFWSKGVLIPAIAFLFFMAVIFI